jgi:hypothetical protein
VQVNDKMASWCSHEGHHLYMGQEWPGYGTLAPLVRVSHKSGLNIGLVTNGGRKRRTEVWRPTKSVSKEKQTKSVSKKPGQTPRGRLNLWIIRNSCRCKTQTASYISACIFFMWGKNVMGCHTCLIGGGKCDIARFFFLGSLRNKWRCNIKN